MRPCKISPPESVIPELEPPMLYPFPERGLYAIADAVCDERACRGLAECRWSNIGPSRYRPTSAGAALLSDGLHRPRAASRQRRSERRTRWVRRASPGPIDTPTQWRVGARPTRHRRSCYDDSPPLSRAAAPTMSPSAVYPSTQTGRRSGRACAPLGPGAGSQSPLWRSEGSARERWSIDEAGADLLAVIRGVR